MTKVAEQSPAFNPQHATIIIPTQPSSSGLRSSHTPAAVGLSASTYDSIVASPANMLRPHSA